MSKKPCKAEVIRAKAEARFLSSHFTLASPQPRVGRQHENLHELHVNQIDLDIQNDELRKLQLDLEVSRDRYLKLYEIAPICYLTISLEGNIEEINLAGAVMFGSNRNTLLNKSFASFVVPAHLDIWHRHYSCALKSDELISDDLAMHRSDGSVNFVRMNCQKHGFGHKHSIFITLIDNSESKCRQHEAENLLRRYQILMQNSKDGIHILNGQGNLVQFNNSFCEMLGYSREEMAVLNVVDWAIRFPGNVKERLSQHLGKSLLIETVHRHKDGRLINVEVSITGEQIGGQSWIFCSSRDITTRKIAEQSLITRNYELTREVTRNNTDLSELTAYIQQISETEKANLARELHDEMGSLLNGIGMRIGHLQEKNSASDFLNDLSSIQELVSKVAMIAYGITNKLYPANLVVYGLVAAIESLTKEFKKHSGIEVELVLPEEKIAMDQSYSLAAYRITQECLTNIFKHSKASKVLIELKTCNGLLDLTVQDNGKGMPEKISDSRHGILGMFERARYLGGSIKIWSEKGNGTTAHLLLPLAVKKPKIKKRVLVVDDHAIVRDAIRQLLDSQTDDFLVAGEASDGKAAIQMANEGVWDLMLLDITLPKKNGIEVLEEIMKTRPNFPIIMLSSHPKEEFSEIAISKGAACYIEKSQTSKLLEAMVQATQ